MSPALAGRFFTTTEAQLSFFKCSFFCFFVCVFFFFFFFFKKVVVNRERELGGVNIR